MKTLAMTCFLFEALLVLGGRCIADEPGKTDPLTGGKPLSAWIEALKAPDYKTRVQAAEAIGRLGPRGKAAMPALRKALDDRNGSASVAGAALWKVDREVFTGILKDRERGSHARWAAILSLPTIGTDAKELVPVVLKIATDVRDSANREHALLALGFIGANPDDVLPVLTAALQEERGQYARMLSAQALGHLGAKAKDALPLLHKALADPDAQVRVDAACAAWKIDHKPEKVLPVLAAAVTETPKDGSESAARQRAIHGLGEMGPRAKTAFRALLVLWKAEKNDFAKGEIAAALKAVDAKAAGEAGVR